MEPPRARSGEHSATGAGAVFVLSFDCEGRWGLADRPDALPGLSSAALLGAYRELVGLLGRYRVAATFAFVAAFLLTPKEARRHADWFAAIPYRDGDWAAPFRAALAGDALDGWLCPEALEVVAADARHEIAAHGFSHVPLAEHLVGADTFEREMDLLRRLEQRRGLDSRTFVYPRNLVGYTARLAAWGFEAYRPMLALERAAGRARRLLAELDPREPPQGHGRAGVPLALPPGRFLNHRAGLRRLVPRRLTRAKLRQMLERAVRERQAVHLYSHPHNFLTGRGQFELLEELLAEVRARADAGTIEVMTQHQYARAFAAAPGPP